MNQTSTHSRRARRFQFRLRTLLGLVLLVATACAAYRQYRLWHAPIDWQEFSPERVQAEQAKGHAVLVSFTADWDPNVKYNEKFVINTERVRREVNRRAIVVMSADWTDGSDRILKVLHSLGHDTIPLLAIYPPNAAHNPIALEGILTEQQVLDAIDLVAPAASPFALPNPVATLNPLILGAMGLLGLILLAWGLALNQTRCTSGARSNEIQSATNRQ